MSATPYPLHPARGAGVLQEEMEAFARMAARSGHAVLLSGETGSGKTFLARAIHEMGARREYPFIRVNCAALPESLFEREHFGHVRGAFTDARDAAPGYLSEADGGTLFLDEISELPLSLQPELLAVLEDGRYRRLGSPREQRADVRVIAATNRSLQEMVLRRTFRDDLHYRLCVLHLTLPPLRERRDQIPHLLEHLRERGAAAGAPQPRLSAEALVLLRAHSWPGNVREMENVLRVARRRPAERHRRSRRGQAGRHRPRGDVHGRRRARPPAPARTAAPAAAAPAARPTRPGAAPRRSEPAAQERNGGRPAASRAPLRRLVSDPGNARVRPRHPTPSHCWAGGGGKGAARTEVRSTFTADLVQIVAMG